MVQLKHRLETDLGVVLSLSHVLAGATLAATVEDLVGQLTNRVAAPNPIPTVPTDTARELVAPMSYAQRWLWFLQQLELDATAHIIAVALRLPGPVNAAALRRAVDTLVARHPILRTTFPLRDGEPVQLVAPVGHAAYQEHQARQLDDATLGPVLVRAARRPFDLQSGPLLRLDLYHGAAGDVLLVAVHHIITDFWSLTVLARELGAYYAAYTEGRELTRALPAATYVDFTRWQLSTLDESTAQVDQLTSYWQTVVADGLPKLSLPAIEPRAGDCGGARYFTVAPALARRLRERAAAEKATLYVLLLAAFQVVLHRLTGQHDLVVGTNAAARTRPEFAEVVGCCTNSVMIRSRATAGEPFRALLARTRQGVIGALQHQEYPPTLLAARLGLRRGSLFDVLFSFNRPLDHSDDLAVVALLGPAGVERSLGGLRIERFPLPAAPGTLPIELTMGEVGGVPHGLLRYRGDALDAAAADRLVARFVAMLEEVAADPAIAIGELDRFGEGDRQVRRSGGSDR